MGTPPRELAVRDAFVEQAGICRNLGSPFTGEVLAAALDVIGETTLGRAILAWDGPPDARHDALPLRVAAAFHALARSGRRPELSDIYPPAARPSRPALRQALRGAMAEEGEWLGRWLGNSPQTNEVARAACLYAGLMRVAAVTGLPISLREIGSSAGLNLNLDRYAHTLAGRAWGDGASPLRLAPAWTGSDRLGAEPEIRDRRGCDLSPFDLSDPAQRERLLAYVWADQDERLNRLAKALDIALRYPVTVDREDAADWVTRHVLPGRTGVATILMHSLTWGYIADEGRAAITRHMESVGSQATADAPLGWMALELDVDLQPVLTLRLWPGGRSETLARADPHCSRIDWTL